MTDPQDYTREYDKYPVIVTPKELYTMHWQTLLYVQSRCCVAPIRHSARIDRPSLQRLILPLHRAASLTCSDPSQPCCIGRRPGL